MEFQLGDRVRYLPKLETFQDINGDTFTIGGAPGADIGTVVDIEPDHEFGTCFAVAWDAAPYGEVSPFTGQVYTINSYPADYLIGA
jgi:hypothetical protein